MQGIFAALQIYAAFFLAIFGLGIIARPGNPSAAFLGAACASLGLTFLTLLGVNIRKPR